MTRAAFSQLWEEEEAYLLAAAVALPPEAIVVELGTAQGGSAALFAAGARARGCRIYSYDLAPSREATENLRGLGVQLVAEPSVAGAGRWNETCGAPVDLLFIDASHTLANVFRDYHAWLGWLAPGARVLFHDYDPPERGGVSHLGVRVFLDALLARGVLSDSERVGRILAGRIDDPRAAAIPVSACTGAWRVIGARVSALLAAPFDGWCVLGEADARGEFISFLFGLEGAAWRPAAALADSPERLLIVERPLSPGARSRLRDGAGETVLLDDLLLAYAIDRALRERRDDLLARARNRREFFKWEEYLEMLDHASAGCAPQARFETEGLDLDGLSRRCAQELLRLAFLERLGRSIYETAT